MHSEVIIFRDDAPVAVIIGRLGWHDLATAPWTGFELEAAGCPFSVFHDAQQFGCLSVCIRTRTTAHPDSDRDRNRAELVVGPAKQLESTGKRGCTLELLGG